MDRLQQLHSQLGELLSQAAQVEEQSEELRAALEQTEEVLAAEAERLKLLVPSPPSQTPAAASAAPSPPPPARRRPHLDREYRSKDEETLGYQFQDPELWWEARSDPLHLAIVGDAVLSALVATEGYMTGMKNYEVAWVRDRLLTNANQATVAWLNDLDVDIFEPGVRLVKKPAADQFEALFGAIWIDSGCSFEAIRYAMWSLGMFRSGSDEAVFGNVMREGQLLWSDTRQFWYLDVTKTS